MKNRKTLITYYEKYLINELKEARNALATAYSNFDNVTDPDLIDSCIYQVNSMQKKYQFLIERARLAGLSLSVEIEQGITL